MTAIVIGIVSSINTKKTLATAVKFTQLPKDLFILSLYIKIHTIACHIAFRHILFIPR